MLAFLAPLLICVDVVNVSEVAVGRLACYRGKLDCFMPLSVDHRSACMSVRCLNRGPCLPTPSEWDSTPVIVGGSRLRCRGHM